MLSKLLQLFTAAPKAVALTLLAFDLLLMPLLLAAATGLFVLLPGAPGCAVEAVLVVRLLAAGCSRKDLPAASAGEPILALLLVDLDLHGLLTSSAHFLQQARHFLPSSCFNCALGKASSILASLHTLHGYLMAVSSLRLRMTFPCLHCVHMAGMLARAFSHCSCSKPSR